MPVAIEREVHSSSAMPRARRPNQRVLIALAIALALVTVGIYWRAADGQFVVYDDHVYVTDNPPVRRGLSADGLRWAFTTHHAGNWHPLTWLAHMLDCELFGLNAAWHHRTNVLLHAANSVLLFFVLMRMTSSRPHPLFKPQPSSLKPSSFWASAMVAAIFAVHPLNVESVAWVAEKKNVLSTLFWFLAMLAYVPYTRRPSAWRYALVLATFGLGLLAKPIVVTLPCVLLVLDYWPLGRLLTESSDRADPRERTNIPNTEPGAFAPGVSEPENALASPAVPLRGLTPPAQLAPMWHWRNVRALPLLEKLPMLVLSAAVSYQTIVAQEAARATTRDLPISARIGNAVDAYVAYLRNAVWPSDLAVLYPHPRDTLPRARVAGAACLLLAVTVAAVALRRTRPYFLVGWLWYLGTLVPVIGLVQVGMQSMADRYVYVPLVGIFWAAVWGVSDLTIRLPHRALWRTAIAACVLSCLAAVTWRQVLVWRDTYTLFLHATRVTRNNGIAHYKVGLELTQRNEPKLAIGHLQRAARWEAAEPDTHIALAGVLARVGRLDEAAAEFHEALALDADAAKARHGLGLILLEQGRAGEAVGILREVVRKTPADANAQFDLAQALRRLGHSAEARRHYAQAARLDPKSRRAPLELARLVCEEEGRNDAAAWSRLADAYAADGRRAEAWSAAKRALDLAGDERQPLRSRILDQVRRYAPNGAGRPP